MEFPHEGQTPHPKDAVLFERIDHVLAEESLILDGLRQAVQKGFITEEQKSDWLSEYIDRRHMASILGLT